MPVNDDELRGAVAEELDWDPRIDGSAVAISANAGVVTLRGTVGSYTEKAAAKTDTQRVRGVVSVRDNLDVALLDEYRRDDADLRGAVLRALELANTVPSTVDASVEDSVVTLTGTVSSQFQRAEAQQVTGHVRGVADITDTIKIVPFGPPTSDVAESIEKALGRNARLDASDISITSSSGTVTLRGTVPSWADHDDALIAAWNAPGVVNVVDDLLVSPKDRTPASQ